MLRGTSTLAVNLLVLAGVAAQPAVTPARAAGRAAAAEPRAEIVLTAGHTQAITSLAVSPGNDRLAATSSDDGLVKLWDLGTGRLIRDVVRIDPNLKYWRITGLSGDGRRLIGAAGGEGHVWDTLSGREILTIPGLADESALIMSNDGARIAARRDDKTVALHDGETGRALATLKDIAAASFSQDGRQIIAGRADRTAVILDSTTGARIRELAILDDIMAGAAWSADGGRLAVWSASGRIRLWDLADGRQIAERGGARDAEAVFSGDGVYLAFPAGKETVEVLNAQTGETVSTFEAPADAALAGFSRDNAVLLFAPRAAGNADWELTAVRIATGETANVFKGASGGVGKLGNRIYVKGEDDGTLRWRDIGNRDDVHAVASQPALTAAAFSASGARVALSRRGEISVVDAETGQQAGGCPAPPGEVRALGFSSDGRRLAYGDDKIVSICDVETRTVTQSLSGHEESVIAVSFSADDRRVVSGDNDGAVKIWDVDGGKNVRTFKGDQNAANVVAFSPDGRRVFSGTGNNRIHVWNLATGREEKNLRMLIGPVEAMAVSPDGRRVAAGPWSEFLVKQWDIETGKELRRLQTGLVGRFVSVTDAKYAAAGDHLLAAICNNQFVAWDTGSGQKKLDVSVRAQDFKSIAFSGAGRRLVSVDEAGVLRHWDRRSGAPLVTVFPLGGGAWVRLTPEGFFDAAPGATAGLSAVRGFDAAAIDRVAPSLDRPDLVREKLAGDPAGRVKAAAAELGPD